MWNVCGIFVHISLHIISTASGSNILLKLTCVCPSAIKCKCPGKGSVTALLSDFDLVENATSDGQWDRLSDTEPSGTDGMKALEVLKFISKYSP